VDADEEIARRAALAKAHRDAMRNGGRGGGGARPRGSLQFGVGAGAGASAAVPSRDALGSVGGLGPDYDSDGAGDADEDDEAYHVAHGGGNGRRAAGSSSADAGQLRLGDTYDDDGAGAGAGAGGDDGGFIPLNGSSSQAARRRPPAAVGSGPTALSAAVAAASVPAALRQLATTAPTVALAAPSRELAAGGSGADGSDAKLTSWERAQLKRAGPASSSSSSSSSSLMAKPKAGLSIDEDPAYRFTAAAAAAGAAAAGGNAPSTPSAGPALPDPSVALDRVLSGLGQAVAQARAAADGDAGEVARLQREAAEARASLPGLQAAVSTAASAFDLYQGLRLYLGDYVPCAREKAALVDEWEAAEAAHVAAAGAATLAARRVALAADVAAAQAAGLALVADASTGAAVAPSQQQDGGGSDDGDYAPAAGHARWLAAVSQVVAAAVNGSSDVEDGVIGPARLQQLEEDVADDDSNGGGGSGSIAESARRLRAASSLLLADVHEAYASVGSALGRFAGWRGHAAPSLARTYVDAYAYLALPPLLAPLVRAQLAAGWTPLALPGDAVAGAAASGGGAGGSDAPAPPLITVDPSLDPGRLEWLDGAMSYGDGARPALQALLSQAPATTPAAAAAAAQAPPDAAAVDEAVATDEALLPALVASAALPRVAALLAHPAGVWDPAGAPSSLPHAVAAVRELLVFEPPADRVKELLGAVAGGLQAAALEAAVPVLAATTTTTAGGNGAVTLAAASLGCWLRGLMLLHAVAAWEGVLAPQLLARLGVGQVVGGLLLPAVRWLSAAAAGGAVGGGAAAVVSSVASQPALMLPAPALPRLAGVLLASIVAAVPAGWLTADGHGGDGACADAVADLRRLAAQLASTPGHDRQPGWAAVLAGVGI
jgi:hypothetical protein